MFGDDTQADTSDENINVIVENFNHDLEKVSTWMSSNQLTLNHSKTEYMIVGSNRRINQIDIHPYKHIGGRKIDRVKNNQITWRKDWRKVVMECPSGSNYK